MKSMQITGIETTFCQSRPLIINTYIGGIQKVIVSRYASIILTGPWNILVRFLCQKLIDHFLVYESASKNPELIHLWNDLVLNVCLWDAAPVNCECLAGVILQLHSWHLDQSECYLVSASVLQIIFFRTDVEVFVFWWVCVQKYWTACVICYV